MDTNQYQYTNTQYTVDSDSDTHQHARFCFTLLIYDNNKHPLHVVARFDCCFCTIRSLPLDVLCLSPCPRPAAAVVCVCVAACRRVALVSSLRPPALRSALSGRLACFGDASQAPVSPPYGSPERLEPRRPRRHVIGAEQKTQTSLPQLAAHLRCTALPHPHLQCTQCASCGAASAVAALPSAGPPAPLPTHESSSATAWPRSSTAAPTSRATAAAAPGRSSPASSSSGCCCSSSWQKAQTSPASTWMETRTGVVRLAVGACLHSNPVFLF